MASKFASGQFWIDTFDRVVASFAQGILATAGLDSIGILDIEWQGVLSLAGSYALLSLLTSIAFRGNGSSDVQGKHEA
jgi:hypothetical protein